MSSADETEDSPPEKPKGKAMILVSILAFLLAAGGGFYASTKGLIPSFKGEKKAETDTELPVAFLPIDRIVVTLSGRAYAKQLVFSGSLEVAPENLAIVEALKPRILDILNGYLRAVDETELADPAQLARLRAQMLHRINLATEGVPVSNLLISEFILN
ncbi:flagellar basal body-associated protein FliL [Paracoccaceae bacterium GXU_MW_L88]